MRSINIYLALAAVILLAGCGSAQNTAAPEANGSGRETAAIQATADTADEKEELGTVTGETAEASAKEEAAESAEGSDAPSGAAKTEETVTVVIPTVYESVTTQEEAEKIRKENGYESAVLNDDGSLTIVMSRSQHDEMLGQFKKSVDEGITEIIHTVEDSAIEKIEYNDDYSIFTVTVSGDELGLAERQAADELVMYGTLYHIYSGNDVDHIKVDYLSSGTGEVIETADSGSLDKAY